MRIFTDETQGAEHIALIKGDLAGAGPVLVRMHTLDPLLDVVGIGGAGRSREFGAGDAADRRRGPRRAGAAARRHHEAGGRAMPSRRRPCANTGSARRSCRRWASHELDAADQFADAQGRGAGGLRAVDRRHPHDPAGVSAMAGTETHYTLPLPAFDKPVKLLIVVAPYYRDIADDLVAGARATIEKAGAAHETDRGAGRAGSAGGDRAGRAAVELRRLCRAGLRHPRRDHALRDGLQRQLARADAAGAAGRLHRQRHPDGREPRPGGGARRSGGPGQGRRRGGGGAAPDRAGAALGGARPRASASSRPSRSGSPTRGRRPHERQTDMHRPTIEDRQAPDEIRRAALRGAGAVPDGGFGPDRRGGRRASSKPTASARSTTSERDGGGRRDAVPQARRWTR